MNHEIWLTEPAAVWAEAFPIGNGELGGMVFGGTMQDRIALNTDALWSGSGQQKLRRGSSPCLQEARELVLRGDYSQAEDVLQQQFLAPWTEAYLPLGDLMLHTAHGKADCHDYRRSLQLD
ncbi:MAG: glycoside hydrolase N-terminal domain-containing protein, partial [Angelakisella sp.]